MANQSVQEIAGGMIAKLGVTTPGLSLEIGTPERKIIEVVAEAILENTIDSQLIASQLDIDTKSGADLEDFVGVFNFGRIAGTYAVGSVTFTLTIPAVQPIFLPYGTQVLKPGNLSNSGVIYTLTSSATIDIGQSVITVAAQCAEIGVAGNAPSNTITSYPGGLGVSACTNIDPFTGGSEDETDDELRARFKKTFLRNIAGTSDYYQALALQGTGVRRVNILGPNNKYITQVQTGAAAAPVTVSARNCKYVWPEGYAVSKDRGTPSQIWFTDTVDYTFTTGAIAAPVITPTVSCDNDFLDVTYEYTSTNSRNDPLRGIANKIDIYMDGTSPLQIIEKTLTKKVSLSSDPNSVYYTGNFKSYPSGTSLTTSTKFQRLGSTPIMVWPATIVVGATTYTLGTDYFGIRDITLNKGSEREMSGIAWITTPPADGLVSFITYTYNQLPEALNDIVKKTKQITSDPLVHAANKQFLSIYLTVQYDTGANPSEVQPRVEAAAATYLNTLSFGSWIQFSDLTTYIHNVSGIDNVRMSNTGADGAPHIVAEMENGIATGTVWTSDFQLEDDTIPALDSIHLIRRSFNTF